MTTALAGSFAGWLETGHGNAAAGRWQKMEHAASDESHIQRNIRRPADGSALGQIEGS